MLRKRENKNYHSVSFIPDAEEKIPKYSKKIQKIEKYRYGFIPNPNRMEKAETERIEKLSLRFIPSRRGREISKKIQKIEKYHYGFIPRKNRLENAEKGRK